MCLPSAVTRASPALMFIAGKATTCGVDPPPMLLMLAFFTEANGLALRARLPFGPSHPKAATTLFSSCATEQ